MQGLLSSILGKVDLEDRTRNESLRSANLLLVSYYLVCSSKGLVYYVIRLQAECLYSPGKEASNRE